MHFSFTLGISMAGIPPRFRVPLPSLGGVEGLLKIHRSSQYEDEKNVFLLSRRLADGFQFSQSLKNVQTLKEFCEGPSINVQQKYLSLFCSFIIDYLRPQFKSNV